ncbi:hypothetical protein [uncultured Aquimarina sp.]|uniref:hypothetical protein n=1 Tax=uncultured Aquimarina sp. TaxID=575652 RepID=UPI002639327C|nr:hypothetical protein [uncultured Aquimarina sp.]
MKKLALLLLLINDLIILGQNKKNITFDLKNKKLSIDDNDIKSGESYIPKFNYVNTSFMQIKIVEFTRTETLSELMNKLRVNFP